jgi:hypothetical protein
MACVGFYWIRLISIYSFSLLTKSKMLRFSFPRDSWEIYRVLNMKTQRYGLGGYLSKESRSSLIDDLGVGAASEAMMRALRDFRTHRENGEDKDNPEGLHFARDGKYTWFEGNAVRGNYVYGSKCLDDYYDYTVHYDAALTDLAYFEAKDRNYLTRILNERKLKELKPDVWYLREAEGAQNIDIGEWWSQKLKLPNIGTLLTNAKKIHAIATSWQEAPMEICELIATEFPFALPPQDSGSGCCIL